MTDIKEFTLKYFKAGEHPNQASAGLRYEGIFLINENYEQVTQCSSCRAFSIDAFFASMQGLDFGSVCYVNSWRKPDYEKTRIGRVCERENEALVSLDFLNKLEKDLGFSLTTISKASNVKRSNCYMFEGDKRWQISSPMLSLYMVLIRNICNGHTFENTWQQTLNSNSDSFEYDLKNSLKMIKLFVEYGIDAFFKDDYEFNYTGERVNPYEDTHDFGINTFCRYVLNLESCNTSYFEGQKGIIIKNARKYKEKVKVAVE